MLSPKHNQPQVLMRVTLSALTTALLLSLSVSPATAAVGKDVLTVELASAPAAREDALLFGLYERRSFAPLWLGQLAGPRRATLGKLLAREYRLDPTTAPDLDRLLRAADSATEAAVELALTRAFVDYLGRRAGGEVPKGPVVLDRALAQLETADIRSDLTLALLELRLIEATGGWRRVTTHLPPPPPPVAMVQAELLTYVSPETAVSTSPYGGDLLAPPPPPKPEPDVPALRRRLVQSGDLPAREIEGTLMDERLTQAVREFQQRHGLLVDGVVGPRTLAALNQPVAAQIQQVTLNLARLRRTASRERLPRYVVVNVPAYELKLVEGGKVTLRSRAIVGDDKSPTPIFDDSIRFVELNPSWYVPRSIERELLAKLAQDPGYFARSGFVWRGGGEPGGPPPRLVQQPGPENALGRLKFLFPNHHAVYIHDTPQRGLFGRSERSLSHGCIRIEKPFDLAVALLGRQGWDAARLEQALGTSRTRRIELASPVRVFLDYRTAFTDEEGRLQLRPDIYGFDTAGIETFSGKDVPVAALATSQPPAILQR
jgi:murein L,D-transpeptidase YcbB/YkuD